MGSPLRIATFSTIIVLLVAGCYVFNNPVDPEADDYRGYLSPPDLPYRRAITITNPGATLTHYQVAVALDNVVMGSPYDHVNVDGSDLRLRDARGIELSHWIESWDNTGDSLLWVRVPTLPGGDTVIYLYYGDSTLPNGSNPASTFLFFDGFDDHMPGELVDGWTPNGVFAAADDGGLRVLDDTGIGQEVIAGHSALTGIATRQRIRSVSGTIDHGGLIVAYTDATHLIYGGIVSNTAVQMWEKNGGDFEKIGGDWPIPDMGLSWHVQELSILGSTVSVSVDGTSLGSATAMAPNTGGTGFWSQYGSEQGYRDWHLVRKYSSPEPTAVVGSEQAL